MADNRGGPRGRGNNQRNRTPDRQEEDQSQRTQTLALSAWDLARTRTGRPDSPRGHTITLRANQRLLQAFENGRAIPEGNRSVLRAPDRSRGSVLLIHGVSTGPGDLYELADVLYDADYTISVVRLPDYGTEGDTICEVSWEAALELVRQRFRLLARGGGRIHVVGLGFGATLALHLSLHESVSTLILLAPAIMPRESILQRMLVRFKLHRLGFVHSWLGWNADLMEGMDRVRGRIGSLKVPIYAAQCDDDDRASPDSLRVLQRKARHDGSLFRSFPEGGHAILDNHGSGTLFNDIVSFCDGR